jgi:hypothetical protein
MTSESRIMPAQEPYRQAEGTGQLVDRGRLAARDDQAVDRREFRRPPDGNGPPPEGLDGGDVFAHVALHGEHADDDVTALRGRRTGGFRGPGSLAGLTVGGGGGTGRGPGH